MPAPSVFIFAGEASADALGGMVIDGLRKGGGSPDCWGVGGPAMRERGFQSIEPMGEFTVLGIAQALLSIPRLSGMADALIGEILNRQPDAILTIDSKGFSMRFARRLKRRMAAAGWRAPVLHLVAPTVWAWGGWRAREVARSVDHLLCLFPFEAPYFTDRGIAVTVTGHPAAERKRQSRAGARKSLGLSGREKALVLLPGSRGREVRQLLPDMLEAAALARNRAGPLRTLVPVAETVKAEVEAICGSAGLKGLRLCPPAMHGAALAAGDYGLICSGTVTLEAALAGLPGSVYYKLDWISRMCGNLMVDRSKVVLANAVSGKDIYPLFLDREFTPRTMAEAAISGLGKPSRKGGGLMAATDVTVTGGCAATAAAAVIAELGGETG